MRVLSGFMTCHFQQEMDEMSASETAPLAGTMILSAILQQAGTATLQTNIIDL